MLLHLHGIHSIRPTPPCAVWRLRAQTAHPTGRGAAGAPCDVGSLAVRGAVEGIRYRRRSLHTPLPAMARERNPQPAALHPSGVARSVSANVGAQEWHESQGSWPGFFFFPTELAANHLRNDGVRAATMTYWLNASPPVSIRFASSGSLTVIGRRTDRRDDVLSVVTGLLRRMSQESSDQRRASRRSARPPEHGMLRGQSNGVRLVARGRSRAWPCWVGTPLRPPWLRARACSRRLSAEQKLCDEAEP